MPGGGGIGGGGRCCGRGRGALERTPHVDVTDAGVAGVLEEVLAGHGVASASAHVVVVVVVKLLLGVLQTGGARGGGRRDGSDAFRLRRGRTQISGGCGGGHQRPRTDVGGGNDGSAGRDERHRVAAQVAIVDALRALGAVLMMPLLKTARRWKVVQLLLLVVVVGVMRMLMVGMMVVGVVAMFTS